MAYNRTSVWVLLIILVGTLLIVSLHRQQYFTFRSIPNDSRKEWHLSTQGSTQRTDSIQVQENNMLKETLIMKNKEIQLKSEDLEQKTEDLKQKSEDLKQKSEDLKQKSEDLKQKSQTIELLTKSIAKLQTEKDASSISQSQAVPPQTTSPYNCAKGRVLPTKDEMKTMELSQLAELYHSYVENIQVVCDHMRRMGSQADGGWEVCDDATVKPNQPCLVYSVGINNDFTFDDDVGRTYGCEVHAFDPSMKQQDHRRSDRVMFYNLGLGDYDGRSPQQWKMATLNTIRKNLNHTERNIDILKVDIEEWEMKVFPQMLQTQAFHHVTQFVFEIHIAIKPYDGNKERYQTALGILRDLYDLGFRIFFTHRNRWSYFMSQIAKKQRTGCHEINMMKVC